MHPLQIAIQGHLKDVEQSLLTAMILLQTILSSTDIYIDPLD